MIDWRDCLDPDDPMDRRILDLGESGSVTVKVVELRLGEKAWSKPCLIACPQCHHMRVEYINYSVSNRKKCLDCGHKWR